MIHAIKIIFPALAALSMLACKKSGSNNSGSGNNGGGVAIPTDPETAKTIGFFMNEWQAKTFTPPPFINTPKPTAAITSYVTVDAGTIVTKIPAVYNSHNANSWMGQMVTESPLMSHLSALQSNFIRFPGGSISDVYFWNRPFNSPPADAPPQLLDANGAASAATYWGGGTSDSWTLSLNNYYSMLQQTGSKGMITVNYGYARYGTGPNPVAQAAHLAADWVRYDNGRTKYWEIGNECNGTWEAGYRINTATNQDGQPAIITASLYGSHIKVFIDSMRKAAQEIGKTIYIGTYILEAQPAAWQTATDQTWNTGVLPKVNAATDFYIIHSYYTPYQTNASATEILNTATANTGAMMNFYQNSLTVAGNTIKPVALTEYNITSEGAKQQVSFVNGIHSLLVMCESIYSKYGFICRWDLANGYNSGNDHGLFNIGDEPGVPKWNPRPAFYYMYYFQQLMGDRMLKSTVIGGIQAYASSFSSGEKAAVLVNKSTLTETVSVSLQNTAPGVKYYWYTLTGGADNGEFSAKVFVNGEGPSQPTGGPSGSYTSIPALSAAVAGGITVTVPPRSVVYLVTDK